MYVDAKESAHDEYGYFATYICILFSLVQKNIMKKDTAAVWFATLDYEHSLNQVGREFVMEPKSFQMENSGPTRIVNIPECSYK